MKTSKAAITVLRPRDELQRLWESSERLSGADATVTFVDAPGDRGTEIHVEISGRQPKLAKVQDELRHFKALVETGEIPRSDGTPEGESAERKLKQRPAQPLSDDELQKAGVS